jgi:N-acetylneuraminic acid mutarotase
MSTGSVFAICRSTLSLPVNGISSTWLVEVHVGEHSRQLLCCLTDAVTVMLQVWHSESLYVIGGLGKDSILDTTEIYSPKTNKWQTANFKLPTVRLDHACAVLGGFVYVVGGIGDTKDWSTPRDTWFTDSVLALDVAAGTFSKRASLPRKRGDLALAAFSEGGLLAIGGETTAGKGKDARTVIASHETWMYVASRDTWVCSPVACVAQAQA